MSSAGDPLASQRRVIDACLRHKVSFWWHGPGTLLISGAGLPVPGFELETEQTEALGLTDEEA